MRFEFRAPTSHRLRLSTASIILIVAGSLGYVYAFEPGQIWSLAAYVFCLGASTWIMIGENISQASENRHVELQNAQAEFGPASIGETAGLSDKAIRSIRSEPVLEFQTSTMIQQSLDLDGLGALRSLDSVTAQWLVSDASDKAAAVVRMACLERVDGGEPETERAERWFEIADSLRSRECRALPKAELRRSFVADRVGVSKEQVRQIDQGRYLPLNRLLEEVDPKSL